MELKLKQQKERPLNVPRLGLDPHYRVHEVHDVVHAADADSVLQHDVAVERSLPVLQLQQLDPFHTQELDSLPKIESLTDEGAIHYYYYYADADADADIRAAARHGPQV